MPRMIASLIVAAAVLIAGVAQAKVFYSKQSALDAAFPGADEIKQANLYLSEADVTAIGRAAGTPWSSRLTSVHYGVKGGETLGYAFIDTHQVRSLDETLMVVIAPDGTVRDVMVLAFHEPMEYLAPARWLDAFDGRALDAKMSLKSGGVDGLSGATLTARAVTAAVRRVLALHAQKVAPKVSSRATSSR